VKELYKIFHNYTQIKFNDNQNIYKFYKINETKLIKLKNILKIVKKKENIQV